MVISVRKMTKAEAGRLGGLAHFKNVGNEGMRVQGRLGGRPRALTMQDVLERQALENKENERRKGPAGPQMSNSIKVLKRAWNERRKTERRMRG